MIKNKKYIRIDVATYLVNVTGRVPLVLDVRINMRGREVALTLVSAMVNYITVGPG